MKAAKNLWRSALVPLLPLILWGMIILGLQGGGSNARQFVAPSSPTAFFEGAQSVLPLIAACLAVVILYFKLSQHRSNLPFFLSPLGLTGLYGLVGLAGAFLSPSGAVAVYWSIAYLAVPLVLWAIVWGNNELSAIQRVISLNWFVIVAVAVVLFAVELLYLDLGTLIRTPSVWLECPLYGNWQGNSWFDLTSKILRPTGVGRYAALAGIIALGGLWQGRWRSLWASVLIGSMILLLTSGARGSFVGFAAAVPLVIFLHGGKRAVVGGALAVLILVPVFWTTGIHDEFLDNCIFRVTGVEAPQTSSEATPRVSSQAVPQVSSQAVPQVSSQAVPQVSSQAVPQVLNPVSTYQESPSQGSTNQNALKRVGVGGPEPTIRSTVPKRYISFSGRTAVWKEGFKLFKESPVLGYGFHSDRLLLETHMHNSYLHAMLQTGVLGMIPFSAALVFGFILLVRVLRKLANIPIAHKNLVIQATGILVFLSIRSVTESTGAFFGVDWLILAPLLLYLQVVNHVHGQAKGTT